jgi:asparagine synthase (glutamine-hydrolysing)
VERHKQPYRAPDIASFTVEGHLPDYAAEVMGPEAVREAGYFDPVRVARLLDKIAAGRAIGAKDNMAFVGILSAQLWHHLFVKGYADVGVATTGLARG